MADNQTYIIAEMAWSHNGKLSNALAILDEKAGVNVIGIHNSKIIWQKIINVLLVKFIYESRS